MTSRQLHQFPSWRLAIPLLPQENCLALRDIVHLVLTPYQLALNTSLSQVHVPEKTPCVMLPSDLIVSAPRLLLTDVFQMPGIFLHRSNFCLAPAPVELIVSFLREP